MHLPSLNIIFYIKYILTLVLHLSVSVACGKSISNGYRLQGAHPYRQLYRSTRIDEYVQTGC